MRNASVSRDSDQGRSPSFGTDLSRVCNGRMCPRNRSRSSAAKQHSTIRKRKKRDDHREHLLSATATETLQENEKEHIPRNRSSSRRRVIARMAHEENNERGSGRRVATRPELQFRGERSERPETEGSRHCSRNSLGSELLMRKGMPSTLNIIPRLIE